MTAPKLLVFIGGRGARLDAAEARQVLGVASNATRDEIRAAHRALAQIYHPDRFAEAPERVRLEAEMRMRRANQAADVLRSASSRNQQAGSQRTSSPRPGRPSGGAAPQYGNANTRVKHIEGARYYHKRKIVPLGVTGNDLRPVTGAERCSVMDADVERWANHRAAVASAWQRFRMEMDPKRALFDVINQPLARLGQVGKALPCPECRPRVLPPK